MKWQVSTFPALALFFLILQVEGQIPLLCANDASLRGTVRTCCPYNCGFSSNRSLSHGNCVEVTGSRSADDPRINWPIYYFTHVCRCEYRFGGVGCESCAYGYYGNGCNRNYTAPRRNLKFYSEQNWAEYRRMLNMSRNTDSGYLAVVDGSMFDPNVGYNSIKSEVRRISLYNFFVWSHYLVAKDSEKTDGTKKDFAHESTGFLTWHRQMLLWLEWKIQEMLRRSDPENYYKFRLPFWDWTDRTQREAYFKQNRLGETMNNSIPVVHDGELSTDLQLFGPNGMNWQTICWPDDSKTGPPKDGRACDPGYIRRWSVTTMNTGPLKRCPSDACRSHNKYWPSEDNVREAVKIRKFDTSRYDTCSKGSFRNFLEGFSIQQSCSENDRMCTPGNTGDTIPCNRTRTLHNSVHLILGAGDLKSISDSTTSKDNIGVMAHVAASPNDPIFINHHAMIDCIFEQWLQRNNRNQYPNGVNTEGHRRDDYIVPFLPAFTHRDMFKTAENFGYSCNLTYIVEGGNSHSNTWRIIGKISGSVAISVLIIVCVVVVIVVYVRKAWNKLNSWFSS